MAAALGYYATDLGRGARRCFHLQPGNYDTTALIAVLERMKEYFAGERVVLVWDGLAAHRSRAMRAWSADQDWLTLERLPAYAPELNPVELLWSSIKPVSWPTWPATTSPTSPTLLNAASNVSGPSPGFPGHTWPTPACTCTPNYRKPQ